MSSDPLTDEQREIRDLVRDLARERIAPRAAEIDKNAEFPWDVVEPLMPIFGSIRPTSNPGASASTTSAEMPG